MNWEKSPLSASYDPRSLTLRVSDPFPMLYGCRHSEISFRICSFEFGAERLASAPCQQDIDIEQAGIVCFAGRKDADIGEFQYLETSQSLIGTVYIALAEHPAAADETVVIEHIGAEMPFSAVKYRYVLVSDRVGGMVVSRILSFAGIIIGNVIDIPDDVASVGVDVDAPLLGRDRRVDGQCQVGQQGVAGGVGIECDKVL